MRVRFGDLVLTCDFAFCDGYNIIFSTNSKELFKTYYNHTSEARYNLNKLFKDGYLFVANLEEVDRCIGCFTDIVKRNKFEFCED